MTDFGQLLHDTWDHAQASDPTAVEAAVEHRDRLRTMFAELDAEHRALLLPLASLLSRRIAAAPDGVVPVEDRGAAPVEAPPTTGDDEGMGEYAMYEPGGEDGGYDEYAAYDGGYAEEDSGEMPVGRATPDDERPDFSDGLLSLMGVSSWRAGQRETVEAALSGRDALVIMPTGGGKSLCYQLVGLAYSRGLTVVVSPLIALMHDQHGKLRAQGHPADMLVGGMDEEEARGVYARLHAGETRILFVAPERFGSLSLRRALAAHPINLFVVDEAHCISEWGHDFRPDYLRLPAVIESLGHPPTMALTATATPERAVEISGRLGLRDPLETHGGFDRTNLTFDVVALGGKGAVAEKSRILEEGLRRGDMTPAIVYCGTRKDVEGVAERLVAAGLDAVAYHAGMAPASRKSNQAAFLGGDAAIMVATNAFGMGIDKADIRSVWHWALPTSVEGYYQEAGRAGRDGLPSHAVLLSMRADLGRLISFNKRRSVDLSVVDGFFGRISRSLGTDSGLLSPGTDEERTSLAVLERAGVVELAPAVRGQLRARIVGSLSGERRRAAGAAIEASREMGWNAYRAVERFSATHDACRRRQILDHFGDPSTPAPTVRCCDVCEAPAWLEEVRASAPATVKKRSSPANSNDGPLPNAPDIPVDAAWLERLTAWRRERAEDKPAYTVCTNASLVLIAALDGLSDEQLMSVKGIGQSFISKHAESLRETAAERG